MKKFDPTTPITIVLIILLIITTFLEFRTNAINASCVARELVLNSIPLLGGKVYANSIPGLTPVSTGIKRLPGIDELLRYIIVLYIVFLIVYPILAKIKLRRKKETFENKDEYEDERIRLKHVLVRNVIYAFILYWCVMLSTALTSIAYKPIIYIYPETETAVQVSVAYPEKLSCVYPEYDDGWEVIAKPNGDLVDTKTGRNLYCLYWEGNQKQEYKFEDGFVVAGEDSAKFLEEKLAILGLTEREANEFIIYWLPKLEANKYNLIRFETAEEIEAYMPLNIEPKPDSVIRVMMDFKGLNKPTKIEEQKLETPIREGYTVVEWGGSEF